MRAEQRRLPGPSQPVDTTRRQRSGTKHEGTAYRRVAKLKETDLEATFPDRGQETEDPTRNKTPRQKQNEACTRNGTAPEGHFHQKIPSQWSVILACGLRCPPQDRARVFRTEGARRAPHDLETGVAGKDEVRTKSWTQWRPTRPPNRGRRSRRPPADTKFAVELFRDQEPSLP